MSESKDEARKTQTFRYGEKSIRENGVSMPTARGSHEHGGGDIDWMIFLMARCDGNRRLVAATNGGHKHGAMSGWVLRNHILLLDEYLRYGKDRYEQLDSIPNPLTSD